MKTSKIISMFLVIAILMTSLLSINSFGLDAETSDSGFAKLEKLSKGEIVKLVTDVLIGDPENIYVTQPSVTAPYSLGEIRLDVQQNALDRLNAYRRLAGLDPVALNDDYTIRAQAAAVLNAANDVMSHEPERPENAPDELYAGGCDGASKSNLATYEGIAPEIGPLSFSIDLWMKDSEEANLNTLGHRRWFLNPDMKHTGFGYATAADGQVYSAAYAHDAGAEKSDYDFISWPPSGYMANDTEFFTTDHAWSISLNPEKYNVQDLSGVTVELKNDEGKIWNFNSVGNNKDGFFNVNTDGYGSNSNAIIFRPADVAEYKGTYVVTVNGIKSKTTDINSLSYEIEFFSAEEYDESESTTEPTTETTTKPTTTKPTTTTTTTKPTTETTTEPEKEIMRGDVTGDEEITAADARLALRISAKLETPTEDEFKAADVTGDKEITAADARKILRVAAKLDDFDNGTQSTTESISVPPLPSDHEVITTKEFTTTKNDNITVYLGSKYAYYHTEDCPELIDMITPVTLAWAQYKGYKHCKVCNPPK